MSVATASSWAEQTLRLSSGRHLHIEHHSPVGQPRARLIMLHGFAVHCGRYREVAAAFSSRGLSVTAFDCRGHGRSSGRRGYVGRFTHFLDDLDAVLSAVRSQEPRGLPVVVLGHSHGGTIALAYALEKRSHLDGLILAAPWLALKMRVPAWKRALSGVMGRLWPTLTMGNELNEAEAIRDPDVRGRWTGDPLAHHVATPRWFNEVRATQESIRARVSELQTPTLMLLAGDDRIVSTEAAIAFADEAGSIVETRMYAHAFHELFLEPEWERIVEDCASWVVARLSAPYNSKSA